ncbi:MAG: ABC transporter permease [Planctomycetes bacterium]|nr:ABC transporter permease [Planctomycetota bacterium]
MIRAMIEKDLRLLLADRGALFATFLLPLVFLGTFGWIYKSFDRSPEKGANDALPRQKLAFAAPIDPELRERVQKALESGPFRVIAADSADEVERLVAHGDAALGLYLPADFEPFAGARGVLYQDPAREPRFAGAFAGAVQGSLAKAIFAPQMALLGPRAGAPEQWIEQRRPRGLRASVDLDGFQVSTPTNAVLFVFFLVLGMALSFAEERRTGTFARLRSLPIRRGPLLAAKLVPFALIGCAQMLFLFGIAVLVFGLEIGGDLSALLALTVATVLAAVGLGFLVASIGGSEKQIQSYGTLVVLVMGLVSGCMVPRFVLPESAKQVGLLTPHAWALDGYAEVLGRRGTTVVDVLPEIGALLAFAAVFTAVGAGLFARRG